MKPDKHMPSEADHATDAETPANPTGLRWERICLVAAILAVLPLFICLQMALAPDSRSPKLCGGYYSGSVDGLGNVILQIELDGTNAAGSASLNGGVELNDLSGVCVAGSELYLEATRRTSTGEQKIGAFIGKITDSPAIFRGQWHAADTGRQASFELRQFARALSLKRRAGLQVANFGGTKSFAGVFPEFQGDSPFLAEVNRRLLGMQKIAAAEATQEIGGHIWDGITSPGASWNWELQMRTDVIYASDWLISLRVPSYEFSGGAHGNPSCISLNFLADGNGVKKLSLEELFESGSNWEPVISTACIADLKRQGASAVVDGDATEFTLEELGVFTMNSAGLQFHFAPYSVGAYAEGSFTVHLPWKMLLPHLKIGGTASRLAKPKEP